MNGKTDAEVFAYSASIQKGGSLSDIADQAREAYVV